ncbi:hypothetical protein MMN23_03510 [Helicobacter pylori]
MVEGIKVGGVWFSLCVPIYVPIMGDFTEFECLKSAFNLAHLKKSSCWVVWAGLVSLLGLNIL